MSINASRWARNADVQKSTSKLVLMMLAQHVRYDSDDWLVFASIEYLASVTHLNRKTVIDALARLREIGAIVDTGRKAGGNRSCPIYRLCPENVPSIDAATEQRMASNTWQPELMPQAEFDLRTTDQDAADDNLPEPVAPGLATISDGNQLAPAPLPSMANSDAMPQAVPPRPAAACTHGTQASTTRDIGKALSKSKKPGMAGSGPRPLPKDWALPESWLAWTQRMRPHWSEEKIETVAAMFKSYWRSKAGTAALSPDWSEAWRLWVLRERDAKQPAGNAWSASWTGIQQMAQKLGLEQLPNEPAPHFRARVHEAAGVPMMI